MCAYVVWCKYGVSRNTPADYSTVMVGTSLCTIYNMVPSPDSYRKCEDNHCITLTQFATNSSLYLDTTNTTLLLEPGNHTLDVSLKIRNIIWFAVVSRSSETNMPVVACSHSARTYFTDVSQVHICGLRFIGCRGNQYVSVNRFMVKNSTFLDPPGQSSGPALQLILTTATIIQCSFVNLTGIFHKIWTFVVPVNISLGGVITSLQSNITIIRSTFQGNRATEGGALFAIKQSNTIIFKTI